MINAKVSAEAVVVATTNSGNGYIESGGGGSGGSTVLGSGGNGGGGGTMCVADIEAGDNGAMNDCLLQRQYEKEE